MPATLNTPTPAASVVVMTLNLWADYRWPLRQQALRRLLELRAPDVLAVQELTPATAAVIDDCLPEHDRVREDVPGWEPVGNLWWDRRLLSSIAHGAEPIGGDDPRRQLFWVRLRPHGSAREVIVATAHFVWSGNAEELRDSHNPRLEQTRRCIALLEELAGDGACLFMGDLNDAVHPVRILRTAGFQDSFTALGSLPVPTHPTVPTGREHDIWPTFETPMVLDWQFHRGPIRPRMTEAVELFAGEIAPSDHKPVVTLYALDPHREQPDGQAGEHAAGQPDDQAPDPAGEPS